MKPIARNMTIAITGASLIAFLASPLMASDDRGAEVSDPVRLAHMSQGHGTGRGGHMDMMASGMMASGMMGSGTMGQGMGHAAVGAVEGWHCASAAGDAVDREFSVDDVRERLEQSLKRRGNTRLKVGDVTETNHNTIIADIVTVDDSLVRRMEIDRQTGSMRSVQ